MPRSKPKSETHQSRLSGLTDVSCVFTRQSLVKTQHLLKLGQRSIFACWSSLVPHSCSLGFPSGKYWQIQTLGLRPSVCIGQYLPSGNPSEQLCGTREDQQANIDLRPRSVNVRFRLGSCPPGLYSIVLAHEAE